MTGTRLIVSDDLRTAQFDDLADEWSVSRGIVTGTASDKINASVIGVPASSTTLGTANGLILTNNGNVKLWFTQLEGHAVSTDNAITSVNSRIDAFDSTYTASLSNKTNASALGISGTAVDMGPSDGTILTDNVSAKVWFSQLESGVQSIQDTMAIKADLASTAEGMGSAQIGHKRTGIYTIDHTSSDKAQMVANILDSVPLSGLDANNDYTSEIQELLTQLNDYGSSWLEVPMGRNNKGPIFTQPLLLNKANIRGTGVNSILLWGGDTGNGDIALSSTVEGGSLSNIRFKELDADHRPESWFISEDPTDIVNPFNQDWQTTWDGVFWGRATGYVLVLKALVNFTCLRARFGNAKGLIRYIGNGHASYNRQMQFVGSTVDFAQTDGTNVTVESLFRLELMGSDNIGIHWNGQRIEGSPWDDTLVGGVSRDLRILDDNFAVVRVVGSNIPIRPVQLHMEHGGLDVSGTKRPSQSFSYVYIESTTGQTNVQPQVKLENWAHQNFTTAIAGNVSSSQTIPALPTSMDRMDRYFCGASDSVTYTAPTLKVANTGIASTTTGFQITHPTGPGIYSGSGSPEGVLDAPLGSEYHQTNGSGLEYTKRTALGTLTGWVASAGVGSYADLRTGTDTNKSLPVSILSTIQTPTIVTYTASWAPDLSTNPQYRMTLTGALTIDNPTNSKAGDVGIIELTQDTTGGWAVSFGTNWIGNTNAINRAPNAISVIRWRRRTDTKFIFTVDDGGTARPLSVTGTSPTTYTFDSSRLDYQAFTALANDLTIPVDVGVPVNGQSFRFRIRDNGTSRTITFTRASYGFRNVSGAPLPLSGAHAQLHTTPSKITYVRCIFNSTDSLWDIIEINTLDAAGSTLVSNRDGGSVQDSLDARPITATVTTASTSTLTPVPASANTFAVSAQAVALAIAAPTGTVIDGQTIRFRLKDNATAQTIIWDAIYRAIGVTLPTTTVISKLMYVTASYNATDTKWDVTRVDNEA